MSVRKTESRLPGGIANASSFGFADINAANNAALISYLGKDLAYQFSTKRNENKPIRNTYTVFIDETFLAANDDHGLLDATEITYEWEVDLITQDQIVIVHLEFPRTDVGILLIHTDDMQDLLEPQFIEQAAFFRVRVRIFDDYNNQHDPNYTPYEVFTLVHRLGSMMGIIDLLKEIHSSSRNAFIGHEWTTRMVANDYGTYLYDAGNTPHFFEETSTFTELKTPQNVVAAILYQNVQGTGNLQSIGENPFLENVLNMGDDPFSANAPNFTEHLIYELINGSHLKVGITGIKPHFLAMFLPKNDQGAPFTSLQKMDEEGVTEKSIYDAYAALEWNELIDIYNYLRFPKTNIKHAAFLLDQLKNEHAEWRDLEGDEQFQDEGDCVRTIATEFTEGPHNDLNRTTRTGAKTFPIGWSPYVQMILMFQSLPFERIKIKLLDIRSGQAIASARVKKLIVKATDNTGTILTVGDHKYSPYSTLVNESNRRIGAQKALKALGFEIETPGNTFGADAITAFNDYWVNRMPDGAIQPMTTDNEDMIASYLLNYIIDEYNEHRVTDADGVLNVRIPLPLLQYRAVHLEVGFWNCPIVLEKTLSNPDATALLRPTAQEGPTDFKISWIVDYQFPDPFGPENPPFIEGQQTTDWNRTIEGEGDFGWQVEDDILIQSAMLKVCEKLVVKNTTTEFVALFNGLFSPFYHESNYPNHFVLFGMQWCQPVYDDFEDGDINGSVNINTSIQNPNFVDRKMHLITHPKVETGQPAYNGKVYGKMSRNDYETPNTTTISFSDFYDETEAIRIFREAVQQNPNLTYPEHSIEIPNHQKNKWRLRLYAKIGDPVFAIRNGLTGVSHFSPLDANDFPLPPENLVIHIISSDSSIPSIDYHLLGIYLTEFPYDFVLPGQVIGVAGRLTGTGFYLDAEPINLELYVGQHSGGDTYLINEVDPDNQVVIPTEDLPLVFPCRTQITQPMELDGTQITETQLETLMYLEPGHQILDDAHRVSPMYLCQFGNPDYVKNCWAAAEMKCPHMIPTAHTDIQLQIQLRYLNEKSTDGNAINFATDTNPQYLHPGNITGNIGTAPASLAIANNFDTSQTVQILASEYNGLLVRINLQLNDNTNVNTWVAAAIIGSDNRLPQNLDLIVNNSGSTSGISQSRMSIYQFRSVNDLLRLDNYASNFAMDFPGQPVIGADTDPWTTLNLLCFFPTN